MLSAIKQKQKKTKKKHCKFLAMKQKAKKKQKKNAASFRL